MMRGLRALTDPQTVLGRFKDSHYFILFLGGFGAQLSWVGMPFEIAGFGPPPYEARERHEGRFCEL